MDKFAPFGSILAEALPCLSKDVIGVIARYLVAGKAAADTIPLLLCEFNGDSERGGQPWSSGRPLYIACRPDAIWVSDSVSVQIFDAECRFLGVAEHDIEQRWEPAQIVFTSMEALVLHCPRVLRYGLDGKHKGLFASDSIRSALSLAVHSPSDTVFVSDHSDNRIKRFDARGTLLHSWSVALLAHEPSYPRVIVSPLGEVYVSRGPSNYFAAFDLEGKYLSRSTFTLRIGEKRLLKEDVPDFAFSRTGQVFASYEGFVHVFEPDGQCVTAFSRGDEGPSDYTTVCVDHCSGRIFVADANNSRLSVFAFEL